jgi:hypothetical protein
MSKVKDAVTLAMLLVAIVFFGRIAHPARVLLCGP